MYSCHFFIIPAIILLFSLQTFCSSILDFDIELRNRVPAPYTFRKAVTADSLRAWIIGDFGTLLSTVDGGMSWNKQMFSGKISEWMLADIEFLDSMKGWINTRDSLYYTSDGGRHWKAICESKNFSNIHFIDTSRGWASSYNMLFRTVDGGKTWETILPYNTSILDHFFLDSRNGWIVKESDYRSEILRSTDSGKTWNLQYGPTTIFFYNLQFLDSLHGACSSQKAISYTKNGGIRWDDIGFNYYSQINSIALFDTNTIWAAGCTDTQKTTGYALHVEDMEKEPKQVPIPKPYELISVAPFTAHKAIIAGGCGSLYLAQEKDDSSYDVHDITKGNSNDLNDIMFTRSGVGFAAGDHGTILCSLDSGDTWNEIPAPTSNNISKVFFLDKDTGWVFFDSSIARTFTGGSKWEIFPLRNHPFPEITFVNSICGYLMSLIDGRFWFTTDGGKTWQDHFTTFRDDPKFDSKTIDNMNAWIGNNHGIIARTMDGGTTWKLPFWNKGAKHVFFADTGYGFVVDSKDTICIYNSRSKPSLQYKTNISSFYGGDIVIIDSLYGFASPAQYGSIFTTSDGGNTWNSEVFSGTEIRSFTIDHRGNIWATGQCGMIARLIPKITELPVRSSGKPSYIRENKMRHTFREGSLTISGYTNIQDLTLKIFSPDGRLLISKHINNTGTGMISIKLPSAASYHQLYIVSIVTPFEKKYFKVFGSSN